MAFFLPIYVDTGSGPFAGVTVYNCALNVNERTPVSDESGTPIEVDNDPDTTATLGGKLKVVLEDGTTSVQVAYVGTGGGPVVLLDVGPGEAVAGQGKRDSEVAS